MSADNTSDSKLAIAIPVKEVNDWLNPKASYHVHQLGRKTVGGTHCTDAYELLGDLRVAKLPNSQTVGLPTFRLTARDRILRGTCVSYGLTPWDLRSNLRSMNAHSVRLIIFPPVSCDEWPCIPKTLLGNHALENAHPGQYTVCVLYEVGCRGSPFRWKSTEARNYPNLLLKLQFQFLPRTIAATLHLIPCYTYIIRTLFVHYS
jgi:hypothetical protein